MKHPDPIHATAIAWLLFVLAVPFARADEMQLPKLMHLLAQTKAAKATFVEKTYIGIIDRPLVSKGDLSFVAPDSLEKRTLTPKPELLVLRGDMLTIERPGKRRMTVSLEEHPEISAFIESIRGTLAGDLSALKTFYTLQLTGSMEKWLLVLTPKQQRLSRIFSRIRISGSRADVKTIELDQRDGDHSVMTITPVSHSR
ncbi:MAG: outer membrane lipoprotein carrier protein LolA [Acidiferrobacterales bacterium]